MFSHHMKINNKINETENSKKSHVMTIKVLP